MKGRKVKKEWNLRQIGNMALIVGVFAIFLVGICFVRFSKAYVNAFIGNYTGIEEMLATMKGGANTDVAKRERYHYPHTARYNGTRTGTALNC